VDNVNLYNFEGYIDQMVQANGFDYYLDDLVISLDELNHFEFKAIVQGTAYYHVSIHLNENLEIIYHDCDCLDEGVMCKHQIAVLYSIQDTIENDDVNKGYLVEEILVKQRKKELINLIIDLSKEHESIQNEVLFRYSSKENELESSRRLLSSYIDKSLRNNADIDYVLSGVGKILKRIDIKLNQGQYLNAIKLSVAILDSLFDFLNYYNHDIAFTIDEILMKMKDMIVNHIDSFSKKEHEMIYQVIMDEVNHPYYDEWDDWRINLLSSCLLFEDKVDDLFHYLDDWIDRIKGDNWITHHLRFQIKNMQLKIISKGENTKTIHSFIYSNLIYPQFREIAINNAFNKAEYHEVINLCLDGELHDHDNSSLLLQWKSHRQKADEMVNQLRYVQDKD